MEVEEDDLEWGLRCLLLECLLITSDVLPFLGFFVFNMMFFLGFVFNVGVFMMLWRKMNVGGTERWTVSKQTKVVAHGQSLWRWWELIS